MTYHQYQCPTCKTAKFTDGPRSVMQLRCEKPGCFGRLDWVATHPGPLPPPLPLPGTLAAMADPPVTINRAGSYCTYQLTYNPTAVTIQFTGTCGDKNYALDLDTNLGENSRKFFEPPKYQRNGEAETLVSQFFVFSPIASKDWFEPPALPENRDKGALKSAGHGKGLSLPIRIQIGRQDPDDQHSGSGLIHLMFGHHKPDLQAIFDVLRDLMQSSKIGAIYRTKLEVHGHHRYFFLSRSKTPNCLVTEGHADHHRVITLYKLTDFGKYNKFARNPAEYLRLYSWDTDVY